MGEVVTHAQFGLSKERMDELRDTGVLVQESATLTEDDLELAGPAYGEEILGDLLPEEVEIFKNLWHANKDCDDAFRQFYGSALKTAGDAVIASDRDKTLDDAIRSKVEAGELELSEPDAKRYFRNVKRRHHLYNMFHWLVGERLDEHHNVLGVRSKWRVVRTQSRYKDKTTE